MQKEISINPIYGISIILFFLFLLFAFLRQLFLKGIIHFKLLKELYPKELDGINSYFYMMWFSNIFRLDAYTVFWFWMPLYYTKKNLKNLEGKALEYHLLLKKINKKIEILFLIYILYIVGIWLLAYVL